MTPEQERLLKETYELVKDNNSMLRSARRSAIIGGFLKMLFYAVMIVLPTYFFYKSVVPMLTNVGDKYQDASAKAQSVGAQVQQAKDTLQQVQGLMNGNYMSQ